MKSKYIKYNNIYWFLIDGLRPDFLHISAEKEKQNFIDKLCSEGTTFNHVMTAGGELIPLCTLFILQCCHPIMA